MTLPTKTRSAERRLLDSLAEQVRERNPDLPVDAVMREAQRLYEGPERPSALGPAGLHWRELRNQRIMADIKSRANPTQWWRN